MKRIVSLMLLFVMLLSSVSAVAEDGFTLHSGVKFGLSAEEAIEAASKAGDTFTLNKDGRLTNTNEILLADYPVEIFFDLDEDGRIVRQQYVLTWSMNDMPVMGKKWQVDAEELSDALVRTYGENYGDDHSGTTIPLLRPMAGPIAESIDFSGNDIPLSYYNIYRQWLVPDGENYVAVELYQFHYIWTYAQRDVGSKTYIDYTPYTQEEIDMAAAQAEQAAQEETDAYYSGF